MMMWNASSPSQTPAVPTGPVAPPKRRPLNAKEASYLLVRGEHTNFGIAFECSSRGFSSRETFVFAFDAAVRTVVRDHPLLRSRVVSLPAPEDDQAGGSKGEDASGAIDSIATVADADDDTTATAATTEARKRRYQLHFEELPATTTIPIRTVTDPTATLQSTLEDEMTDPLPVHQRLARLALLPKRGEDGKGRTYCVLTLSHCAFDGRVGCEIVRELVAALYGLVRTPPASPPRVAAEVQGNGKTKKKKEERQEIGDGDGVDFLALAKAGGFVPFAYKVAGVMWWVFSCRPTVLDGRRGAAGIVDGMKKRKSSGDLTALKAGAGDGEGDATKGKVAVMKDNDVVVAVSRPTATRVVMHTFTTAETSAVVARARQLGVSVTALLCGSMAVAIAPLTELGGRPVRPGADAPRVPILGGIAVDARAGLGIKKQTDGAFNCSLLVPHRSVKVVSRLGFELYHQSTVEALEAHHIIAPAVASGEPLQFQRFLNTSDHPSPKELENHASATLTAEPSGRAGVPVGYTVSNLGHCGAIGGTDKEDEGAAACGFCLLSTERPSSSKGLVALNAMSADGVMTVTLGFLAGSFSVDFVEGIRERLVAALVGKRA
ncbi:hypothetical protein HK101_002362 [Irineochytrium annulatum]|nr:hypothetical protein HK101_002362 [Irineochytrium annulatum]